MRSWAWLLPVLFSFIYGIAGLYILAIAPDYYTRCDEDPHPHTCSRCTPHAPHIAPCPMAPVAEAHRPALDAV